jgi:AcrR family transcriptional regulator
MLRRNFVMDSDETTDRVCRALARGRLGLAQLTARGLATFLGKTTSVVYHHHGSLDGFLFAVSQRGFAKLGERLRAVLANGDGLEQLAAAFVRFGLESPALYAIMFERRYDWAALRRAGAFKKAPPGMALWTELVAFLHGAGSGDPDGDARLILAGLHGTVSLAASGRANVGALSKSDREVALASARSLARRLCPAACRE